MTAPTTLPLGRLTDEELVVLSPPGHSPVLPVWSRLDPDARAAAGRLARRALVARGLVDTELPGRDGVRRDVRAVLALREAASVVVAVARASERGGDHWYAHCVADVVLLERVSAAGEHDFALARLADLGGLVVGATLAPGGGTRVRADVEVTAGGATASRLAIASGPSGTWRLRPDGDPEPLGEGAGERLLLDAVGDALSQLPRPSARDATGAPGPSSPDPPTPS